MDMFVASLAPSRIYKMCMGCKSNPKAQFSLYLLVHCLYRIPDMLYSIIDSSHCPALCKCIIHSSSCSPNYPAAIQSYQDALQLEPDNMEALYELSFSYMVSFKNTKCIQVAKRGYQSQSPLKARFLIPLASCYSQKGDTKQVECSHLSKQAKSPTE